MRPTPPTFPARRAAVVAGGLLVASVIAVYWNSRGVPFLFDDQAAIVHNPTIRDLGDLGRVFSPPGDGVTVAGRPLLNFSFALNYASGGLTLASYHWFNLAVHALAALTLFGILRRTLGRPAAGACSPAESLALALVAAGLWALHPLQTEAVTYLVQRAESLMGLCYLLTLYAFIRGSAAVRGEASAGWYTLSALACLAGMTTKEVMVSAPLVILLYDRTFVAAGFREALRRRWPYYLALAATEIPLFCLALGTGNRGGTAGFGIDVGPWAYWQTQFQAVCHYLWLTFWPSPLIFDYGVQWVRGASEVVPYALVVTALLAATLYGLIRRHPAGFLGFVFFAVLAPTSLVPGNRQTLAEHRMYLPLAVVVALVVCGGYRLIPALRRRALAPVLAVLALSLGAGLGALSVSRNADYRSELALDRDTARKRPGNASAQLNLANVLRSGHEFGEAIELYQTALRIRPDYYQAHYDLAIARADSGDLAGAAAEYGNALRLKPEYPEALNNLGILEARTGQDPAAAVHLAEAVRLRPGYAEAHYNLGLVLARGGAMPRAIEEFEATLRLKPDFYPAETTLGYALQAVGRPTEASQHLAEGARLRALAPAP